MSLAEDVRKYRAEGYAAQDDEKKQLTPNEKYVLKLQNDLLQDAKEHLVRMSGNSYSGHMEIKLPEEDAVVITGKYKAGYGVFRPVNVARGGFTYKVSYTMFDDVRKVADRLRKEGFRNIRLAVWAPKPDMVGKTIGDEKNGIWCDLVDESGRYKTPGINITKGFAGKKVTHLPGNMQRIYIRYSVRI